FCDPRVVIRARTDCRVQLVVVGNVVAVQAIRTCLKIWRRINIAHAECVEIRHDLARLRKREPTIELQSVGAGWDARLLRVHGKEENVQRSTPNVQRPMKKSSRTPFDHSTFGVGCWAFGVSSTSSRAL